jgi:hypothetical protein
MSKRQNRSRQADAAGFPTVVPGPDFSIRAAQEIPKPKDWQALQRGCVILFQAELQDPDTQEYGRNGQEQRGIDVLRRRNIRALIEYLAAWLRGHFLEVAA